MNSLSAEIIELKIPVFYHLHSHSVHLFSKYLLTTSSKLGTSLDIAMVKKVEVVSSKL